MNPFDDPKFFSSKHVVPEEDMVWPEEIKRNRNDQQVYDFQVVLAVQKLQSIRRKYASKSTKQNLTFLLQYYYTNKTYTPQLLEYAQDVVALHRKLGKRARHVSRAGAIETKRVISENIKLKKLDKSKNT